MGTGVASGLPFHAAGCHEGHSTESTIDQCVPSYTPSIKALSYAQECALRASQQTSSLKSIPMVTIPTTPGFGSLDGVYEENSAIQDVVETHNSVAHDSYEPHHTIYTTKTMEHPTPEATLAS